MLAGTQVSDISVILDPESGNASHSPTPMTVALKKGHCCCQPSSVTRAQCSASGNCALGAVGGADIMTAGKRLVRVEHLDAKCPEV